MIRMYGQRWLLPPVVPRFRAPPGAPMFLEIWLGRLAMLPTDGALDPRKGVFYALSDEWVLSGHRSGRGYRDLVRGNWQRQRYQLWIRSCSDIDSQQGPHVVRADRQQ